jgi:hypothetical protein
VLADSKTAADARRTEVYQRTLDWIQKNLKPQPVMLFEAGDLSGSHGAELSHWKSLHDCLTHNDFWNKIAYFPTIGDHDCGASEYNPPTIWGGNSHLAGAYYHEFFNISPEIRSNAARDKYRHLNERFWAFEYKNCLFVSMDGVAKDGMRGGAIYGNKYGEGGLQKAWMDKVMSTSKAQHIFLFSEHGAYTNFGKDAKDILEKNKATAFFCGHEHNYGRVKESDKTCTYYVTGTAASGSTRIDDPWKSEVVKHKGVLTNVIGFVLVHVKGDTVTTNYYCMDYTGNNIGGKLSKDVYAYSPDCFLNMPEQSKKFLSGSGDLIGWIMDVNTMTSSRPAHPSSQPLFRGWAK